VCSSDLSSTTSPLNIPQLTLRDGIGRVVRVNTQLDRPTTGSPTFRADSTEYDDLDRVTFTRASAPAYGAAAAMQLETVSHYDDEDNLIDVTRRGAPLLTNPLMTKWTYDLLNHRVTTETQDGGTTQSPHFSNDTTFYDEAGNVKTVYNRRLLTTGFTYDALNRMIGRSVQNKDYPQETIGMANPVRGANNDVNHKYPYYPNNASGGYSIYQDNATFVFDQVTGFMTDATNLYAQVHRDYYKNGLLKSETLRIANWAGAGQSPTFGHTYVTSYNYDKDSRRTRVTYPDAVTAPGQNSVSYFYDVPEAGALSRVTDLLGKQFKYSYNWRGERTELLFPGGIADSVYFQDEGLLIRNSIRNSGSSIADLRDESFDKYDAQGKLLHSKDLRGPQPEHTANYDGLGQLIASNYASLGDPLCNSVNNSVNVYDNDVLGNLSQVRGSDVSSSDACGGDNSSLTIHNYNLMSGRVESTSYPNSPALWITQYDASGNAEWSTYANDFPLDQRDRRSYYSADNVLRAVDTRSYGHSSGNSKRTFEEYWYDALGRRILVRSRRNCGGEELGDGTPDVECAVSLLRRTIWDGSQELAEIQVPGDNDATLENETQAFQWPYTIGSGLDVNHYFGIVAYTFGSSLDQPLSVYRKNYGDGTTPNAFYLFSSAFDIIPFWNNRGQVGLARFNDGQTSYSQVASDGTARFVLVDVPAAWYAYARRMGITRVWHGSLFEDKADKAGTMYRRNRYYDPGSGRFTQEDPLGLAGGMNLYGFGGGDPVNLSDPFGLCPPKDKNYDDCDTSRPEQDPEFKAKLDEAREKATANTWLVLGVVDLANAIADGGAAATKAIRSAVRSRAAANVAAGGKPGFGALPMTASEFAEAATAFVGDAAVATSNGKGLKAVEADATYVATKPLFKKSRGVVQGNLRIYKDGKEVANAHIPILLGPEPR